MLNKIRTTFKCMTLHARSINADGVYHGVIYCVFIPAAPGGTWLHENTPESTCTDQKHWRETHGRHSGERDGEEVTPFTAFPFSSFKAGAWSCSYFNLLTLEPFSLCTIFPLSLSLALSLIYSNANSEPKLWEPRHNQCSYFCMHLNPSHVACML